MAASSAVLALTLVLGAGGASGSPSVPGHPHHCGLFQSVHGWEENENIHGHFYSYGVINLKCASAARLPYRVATLALYGQTHVLGFTCTIFSPELKDGACYKGNLRRRSKVKWVVWAPETDCADPNPPYTPATLPSRCRS